MSLNLKFWCYVIDVYFVNIFRLLAKLKEHTQVQYTINN